MRRRYRIGKSSYSSSYISLLITSCSVSRKNRPVRRLCISDALRADSTRASRLRSPLRDAAIYALNIMSARIENRTNAVYLSWFSSCVRSVFTAFAGVMVLVGGMTKDEPVVVGLPMDSKCCNLGAECDNLWPVSKMQWESSYTKAGRWFEIERFSSVAESLHRETAGIGVCLRNSLRCRHRAGYGCVTSRRMQVDTMRSGWR